MNKVEFLKASELKPKPNAINEYSPMYVPLSSDYISRNFDAEIGTKKFDMAIHNFIKIMAFYADPLKDINVGSTDPEHAKWIVDVLTDLNHVCVKYSHILKKAGCEDMLWEVKRKKE